MATYKQQDNQSKLAQVEAMLEKSPPPEPFVLKVLQKSDDGITLYEPLHVKFSFRSQFEGNADSWTIYGDYDKETGVSRRYWDFGDLDGCDKIDQNVEAIVQLIQKTTKTGKPYYSAIGLDFDISNKPETMTYKNTVVHQHEAIREDEAEKPYGSIGPDDQVPAVWQMPRDYFDTKDRLQRLSIEKQVALKALTEFCSTEFATDDDREWLRDILVEYLPLPNVIESEEDDNE